MEKSSAICMSLKPNLPSPLNFKEHSNEPLLEESSEDHCAWITTVRSKAKHKTAEMIHALLQFIMGPWDEE